MIDNTVYNFEGKKPEKTNFRTSGKQSAGEVLKGKSTKVATVPTIPTKYVTILNPDYHEKKGFMHQAPRFKPEVECETPDPGVYFHPTSYIRDSDSISEKGYGNLCSKAKRFPTTRPTTLIGPDKYNIRTANSWRSVPPSGAFSSFAQPIVPDSAKTSTNPTPAPGSYLKSIFSPDWVKDHNPSSISFRSTTLRDFSFVGSDSLATPGVGTYSNVDPEVIYTSRTAYKNADASSAFDSRSNRSNFTALSVRANPGVGEYESAPQHDKLYDELKPTANFYLNSHGIDRFGNDPAKGRWSQLPGPGAYETHYSTFVPRFLNPRLADDSQVLSIPSATVGTGGGGGAGTGAGASAGTGTGTGSVSGAHIDATSGRNASAGAGQEGAAGSSAPTAAAPAGGRTSAGENRTWGDKRRKPGTYTSEFIYKHNSQLLHPSSFFLSETHRDSFVRGSGLTNSPRSKSASASASASGFVSVSAAETVPVPVPVVVDSLGTVLTGPPIASSEIRPPGPAYYSPKKMRHKSSFHSAKTSMWV